MSRRGGHLAVAVALACACAAACSQDSVVTCKPTEAFDPDLGVCFECPAGTKVDHKTATCVPTGSPDAADAGPDVTADRTDEPVPDVSLPDLQPEATPDAPDVAETVPGEVAMDGSIGALCTKDADCQAGLTCFDWPQGYCTKTGCASDQDCPAGSTCLALLENGAACFDLCSGNQDCRAGYGCKGIPLSTGETHKVCHPANPLGVSAGWVCEDHSECAADLACIALGSVRVCARTGCSNFEPCADGQSCLPLGVMTLCMVGCGTDEECAAYGSAQLKCVSSEDIDSKDVTVCNPASVGQPLGGLCYFPTECASGYCHMVVTGKCSDSGAACGSDKDCKQGLCIQDPTVQKGVCAKPCGSGDPCGAGAYCVQTLQSALCMAECSNYAKPCGPEGFGMKCTYGTLTYPPAGGGKYACAATPGGEAGSACTTDGGCASGKCYIGTLETGYCATECLVNADCPFGTQCQLGSLFPGVSLCTRVCFADMDCQSGFVCKYTTSGTEKICQLK